MQGFFLINCDIIYDCNYLNNSMNLKEEPAKELKNFPACIWAGIVMPLTAVLFIALIFIIKAEKVLNILTAPVSVPLLLLGLILWWVWLLWAISTIFRKYRIVVSALTETRHELKKLRHSIEETFEKVDK